MGATKPRTPGGSGCPRLLAALTLAMAFRSSEATAQNAADAGESDAGSPAVRVFYAWMNAFNSTDTSAKQAFIANHLADSIRRGRSVRSSGGGDSTAGDLLKFSLALRAHQLLDERNIALLWSGKVRPRHEPDEEYGYGFSVKTIDGHRIIGHGGGAPGINADFSVYLDSGYT